MIHTASLSLSLSRAHTHTSISPNDGEIFTGLDGELYEHKAPSISRIICTKQYTLIIYKEHDKAAEETVCVKSRRYENNK